MKTLFLCALTFASTGFTLLPPLAQSTREIQAILSNAQMYENLGSAEMIREINRTEKGYLILTHHYAMQVDVQYIHDGKRIGPAQFQLEFLSPIDLRTGERREKARDAGGEHLD